MRIAAATVSAGALGDLGQHVAQEVHPAALPSGAEQHRRDGLLQAGVCVGDDQLHPAEPTRFEAAQERGPERAVLAVADREAEDLPPPVGAHAGGHHHRLRDDPAVDPGLAIGGVEEHVRERLPGQRPVPKGAYFGVQIGADPADFALADAGVGAECLDQVVDLPGGHAVQVGLHHHREQGLVHPPAAFQQGREERPGPQLRDPQFQIPGGRGQHPRPVPVPLRQPRLGPLVRAGADHRSQLGFDQRLIDRAGGLSDPVVDIGRLQRLQHLEQGRLIQGHRVVPLRVFLGRFTQRLTRWPLDIPEARRQAQDLHHSTGRDRAGDMGSHRGVAPRSVVGSAGSRSTPQRTLPLAHDSHATRTTSAGSRLSRQGGRT